MAKRLKGAGIEHADGFALNTSNYIASEENIQYGHKVSALIGGKHFIIDTGRNGNGALAGVNPDLAWCNPKGRALGVPPTTETGDPLVDAFFWTKPPGESDGECNGGPKAGDYWGEAALDLAKAAKW
jgi:endoglucanase